MKPVEIIGAATAWGGRRRGTEDAPRVLQQSGLLGKIKDLGINATWGGTVTTAYSRKEYAQVTREETYPYVLEFCKRLVPYVSQAVSQNKLPLVLGGDHSIAMATWSAVTSTLNAQEDFGLIYIDAHMDAHTPETAEFGRWGGMYHTRPIASLQGFGEEDLTNLGEKGPKLTASHICLIGARSYEQEEATLLEKHGVRIIDAVEVARVGFKAAWEEALSIASTASGGFGISVDVDVFAPEKNEQGEEAAGLIPSEVFPILQGIANNPDLKALEIAEFNPERDDKEQTMSLIQNLILTMLAKTPQ